MTLSENITRYKKEENRQEKEIKGEKEEDLFELPIINDEVLSIYIRPNSLGRLSYKPIA